MKKFINFILNLIFPIQCLSCGREDEWLCFNCLDKIKKINQLQKVCPICNREGFSNGQTCPECKNNFCLDKVFITANYENELIQKLIKNFKYNFIKDLRIPIAEIMLDFFNQINLINKLPLINFVVLPSPITKKRRRWRGFNQAELLAEIIAKKLNLSYLPDLITKNKNTQEQAELSRKKRLVNVQGSFSLNCQDSIASKNFLIIDDVITTGATLGELAKVLKDNGAKKIWGLVIAKN